MYYNIYITCISYILHTTCTLPPFASNQNKEPHFAYQAYHGSRPQEWFALLRRNWYRPTSESNYLSSQGSNRL